MTLSFLSRFLFRGRLAANRGRSATPGRTFRPRLEPLEDRAVPSSVTQSFTGSGAQFDGNRSVNTFLGDSFDASASFGGRMAADNAVVVILNNNVIGSGTGFTDWTSFSASSGFVPGVNKLDFVVTNWAQNGGNPTGLRVEFGSSSITAAVPEPETYAMLLGGLVMVGAVVRRRKQQ